MQTPFDQADAESLYEQMRPDQRSAIALEFVRCLRLAGDPAADQFTAEAEQTSASNERVEVIRGALETPNLLTAQQAAAVHRYTFERHPDCFAEVLRHPLTQAVLASPGAPAESAPESEAESASESPPESLPTQEWPL
jgi:hypothetical protein